MNIFEHSSFLKDVKMALKTINEKQDFADKVKSDLMYYFWCKSEHEIIISALSSSKNYNEEIKVDIYEQVMLNWEIFIDYLWEHENGRSKNK